MTPTLTAPRNARLVERFRALARQWEEETMLLSSSTAIAAHPAYRGVVALGWDVVPLLLDDLQREPKHWFEALQEITGENPVPSAHWGNIDAMRDDWLSWGRTRGLI